MQFFFEWPTVSDEAIDLERVIEGVPFGMRMLGKANKSERREESPVDAKSVANRLFVEAEWIDVDPQRIDADRVRFSPGVAIEVGSLQFNMQFAGVGQPVARDSPRAKSPGRLANCSAIILFTARRDQPSSLDNDLPTQWVDIHITRRETRRDQSIHHADAEGERFRRIRPAKGLYAIRACSGTGDEAFDAMRLS